MTDTSRLSCRLWRMAVVLLLIATACSPRPAAIDDAAPQRQERRDLSGPYLGQEPPGTEPQLFAPGIVSTGLSERDVAMTPDGKEIYFTGMIGASSTFSAILVTREVDGLWQPPEVAPFSGQYRDLEPAISPDGQRFFFISDRPRPDSEPNPENHDIWWMPREGDAWGAPRNLGLPINSAAPEYFPSLTRQGDLYFTRRTEGEGEAIFRARWVDGAYQEPEILDDRVNAAPTQFNAFIDPDERFLIVCYWGHEGGFGGADYYIVFRSDDDTWSEPVNLGDKINTAVGREWSPYVSPDGRYFFFMSSRASYENRVPAHPLSYEDLQMLHRAPLNGNSDIWWVDAEFLEALRPAAR
jgi:hypothetical protein